MPNLEGLDPGLQFYGALAFVMCVGAFAAASLIFGKKTKSTVTSEFAVSRQLADMRPTKEASRADRPPNPAERSGPTSISRPLPRRCRPQPMLMPASWLLSGMSRRSRTKCSAGSNVRWNVSAGLDAG